jgi:nucleotide-binding universal stress UspA family protein
MYAKILVPLDGSLTSQRGFEEAVALARALKSSLLLLHVVDTLPVAVDMFNPSAWQDIGDALRQNGQALLDRAQRTATEHGVANEPRLIENAPGRVADAIVDEARRADCDLVVMGTHGRRGFGHALLGSDAERVLRLCPVPVLVVRHPDAGR